MANPKEEIVFVLVRTQFASNLGSTVRVMKNMGFTRLALVRPECEVGIEARSFAMKGADILDRAEFYPSLGAAAAKLGLLIGTTGRFREGTGRLISPVQMGEELLPQPAGNAVGIVLGSEDNGLRRDELRLCQWLVQIPTSPEYPVMNLAQAAAIIAYQLHISFDQRSPRASRARATPRQVQSVMQRLSGFLERAELPTRVSPDRIMLRFHKMAARAELEREDLNMLHGVIKELEKKLGGG
jgi:TrmH family RNA methyltransferase